MIKYGPQFFTNRIKPVLDSKSSRLLGIDYCRGIAAIGVVLFHSCIVISKEKYFGDDPLNGMADFGGRGVDFFFVLSGFIISLIHFGDIGRKDRLPSYFLKRVTRVFPMMLVVSIPFMVLYFLSGLERPASDSMADRIFACVSSLLLIPSSTVPLPSVLWTLKHEMLFYYIFGLTILFPRIGLIWFVIWMFGCVIYSSEFTGSHFLSDFLFSPYNLEFILGVVCGVAFRKMTVPVPRLLLLVGLSCFIVFGIYYRRVIDSPIWIVNPTTLLQVFQFGLASTLIVIGTAQLDRMGKIPKIPFFQLIGAASYTIYLVHLPVIVVTAKFLRFCQSVVFVSPMVAFTSVVFASLIAGILIHLLVEVRFMELSRRLTIKLVGERQNH
jgi:exopolysaccharide production protein ExoZ